MNPRQRLLTRLRSDSGFTMIAAVTVMFVASLLLIATFTAAHSDINLTRADTNQKRAYYAALAGVQEYENKLETNPNYWTTCERPLGSVPGEANEQFEIKLLPANKTAACNTANPFETMIESTGPLANTFRIESVGTAGGTKRALVATFQVSGFLNYIYFTQYEVGDPEIFNTSAECGKHYRAERQKLGLKCLDIVFGEGDNVNGPMHTDDTALLCGAVEFGRKGHNPLDLIEMNGGTEQGGCGGTKATFNTPSGSYITGPEITAPESDTSLTAYVEHEPQQNEFTGLTHLVLEGTKIKVTTIENKKNVEKTIEWPKNGIIFVSATEKGCGYTYSAGSADTSTATAEEESCGSVYVSGNYSKSLTVAAENDLIINGNLEPTGITKGNAPSGTTTLGLIASRYVRVYHPCQSGSNQSGTMTEPWIYAAILSTSHSFIVDNYNCGPKMKNLNVYGAIAQKFRGPVGLVGGSGYEKEYKYDDRLATDEPPYFLAPLKAGWKIARETTP